MRLPLVALSAAALAALSGCGGGTPLTPDAAWTVNISADISGGSNQCMIPESTGTLGTVSADAINARVSDGTAMASITCAVSGTGPYAVNAQTQQGADTLTISIPSITSAATATAPALGSVIYASNATVATFSSGSCNFWFPSGSGEGVNPGQIWVTFDCPTIVDASTNDTCSLPSDNPSVALFESCDTTM
jgi:hypothetical protein